MTDRMNAPLPIAELRRHVRDIADACIVDSMISYVAGLREDGLISIDNAEVIIDEWSSALHETGVMTRELLEERREGRMRPVAAELDAHVEQLIEERRESLRVQDDSDRPDNALDEG